MTPRARTAVFAAVASSRPAAAPPGSDVIDASFPDIEQALKRVDRARRQTIRPR